MTDLVLGARRLGPGADGRDRLVAAMLAIRAALALLDPPRAAAAARFPVAALLAVAPWLMLSVGRGGWLGDPPRPCVGNGGCGGAKVRNPKPPVWNFRREGPRGERVWMPPVWQA